MGAKETKNFNYDQAIQAKLRQLQSDQSLKHKSGKKITLWE